MGPYTSVKGQKVAVSVAPVAARNDSWETPGIDEMNVSRADGKGIYVVKHISQYDDMV